MNTVVNYFKGVRSEIEKVEWPKRTEVIRLTLVVLSISAIIGVYVGAIDFGLTKILGIVVGI